MAIANGMDSRSYQASQQALYQELAKSRLDKESLDPPHVAYMGGFMYEYTHSFAHFVDCPRGPPGARIPQAICLYNISPKLLAMDALNILAQDERNKSVLDKTRSAVVAPPVPGTKKQDCWRLFLIGDLGHEQLWYNVLEKHVRHHYMPIKLHTSFGPIPGLETYVQLRAMYDRYYSRHDGMLNTCAQLALTLGPRPVEPTSTALTRPATSAWQTLPSGRTVLSSSDFPSLGTALTRRVNSSSSSELALTAAFEAKVETYVKKALAEEREAMMKETAAAIDSIKVTTEAALAAMDSKIAHQDTQLEQRLSDSLLLSKVDSINRSIESLHMRSNALLATQRELAALSKAKAAATEREALAQQIATENIGITNAKTRLRNRHAALLAEAATRGLVLDDLDELNF